jgi:hypothetical protein
MVPGHTPPRIASRAGSGGPRWLGRTSLALALVFPLTYAYVVTVVLVRNLTPSGGNPFAASLYTIFDYFEWPLPILAVIVGHVALARGGRGRGAAIAALVLGYLSILALLGTVIALALSNAANAH